MILLIFIDMHYAAVHAGVRRRNSVTMFSKVLTCALLCVPFCGNPATAAGTVGALVREAEAKVGVSVSVPSTPDLPDWGSADIRFAPLSTVEAAGGDALAAVHYLNQFIAEYAKYPRSFLAKIALEWVVFVKRLRVGGEPRAGTYVRWRTPTTHLPRGGIVYDVQHGARNDGYVRWTLHHELFHFIDEAVIARGLQDAGWLALNAKGFRYTGRPASYSNDHLANPLPGILTAYAAKSSYEDRAELFAALMTDNSHPRLCEIAGADYIIRQKIKYLVRFLERIDPAMGGAYFSKRLGCWNTISR